MQCRYDAPNTPVDAMESVNDVFTAIDAFIRLTTIDGARFRDQGSDVTQDITWTGAATYGSGGGVRFETAQYFNWIGRSPGGRRVRVAVFGAIIAQIGGDYRASALEIGAVDDVRDVLVAAEGTFLAIDG